MRLTYLTQVEISTVGAAIPDTPDRDHAAAITQAATVHVGVPSGIILGNPEEEGDNILAGALSRLGGFVGFAIGGNTTGVKRVFIEAKTNSGGIYVGILVGIVVGVFVGVVVGVLVAV